VLAQVARAAAAGLAEAVAATLLEQAVANVMLEGRPAADSAGEAEVRAGQVVAGVEEPVVVLLAPRVPGWGPTWAPVGSYWLSCLPENIQAAVLHADWAQVCAVVE
jgi:hypothetical protein